MLNGAAKSLFMWDFDLYDQQGRVAEILFGWTSKGRIRTAGQEFDVRRDGWLGPFVLASGKTEVARAVKRSVFFRSFTVRWEGHCQTLRAESPFTQDFVLIEDGRQVGSITDTAWFSRKMSVDLPEDIPLVVQAFLVWLVVFIWRLVIDSVG